MKGRNSMLVMCLTACCDNLLAKIMLFILKSYKFFKKVGFAAIKYLFSYFLQKMNWLRSDYKKGLRTSEIGGQNEYRNTILECLCEDKILMTYFAFH